MIRDLVEGCQPARRRQEECEEEATVRAEERILDLLLPTPPVPTYSTVLEAGGSPPGLSPHLKETREKLRAMLEAGELEERDVEIEIPERP
jgi:ATP-dependent HslUV protease ATP-binding subunit HslU